MNDNNLNARYWEERYRQNDAPWDLEIPSPPLETWIRGLTNTDTRILIPGAGRGHEAALLFQAGFQSVTVLDWSPLALDNLLQKHPEIPAKWLVCQDFFQFDHLFDLILEQTFFCALPPALRPQYAEHMARLLAPGGLLTGVWFDFPLTEKGPPFGGSAAEYQELLKPWFTIEKIEPCYNSHPSRAGKELWIRARKN